MYGPKTTISRDEENDDGTVPLLGSKDRQIKMQRNGRVTKLTCTSTSSRRIGGAPGEKPGQWCPKPRPPPTMQGPPSANQSVVFGTSMRFNLGGNPFLKKKVNFITCCRYNFCPPHRVANQVFVIPVARARSACSVLCLLQRNAKERVAPGGEQRQRASTPDNTKKAVRSSQAAVGS